MPLLLLTGEYGGLELSWCVCTSGVVWSVWAVQEVCGHHWTCVCLCVCLCRLGTDLEGLPRTTPTEQAQSVLKTLRQLKLEVSGVCVCACLS